MIKINDKEKNTNKNEKYVKKLNDTWKTIKEQINYWSFNN